MLEIGQKVKIIPLENLEGRIKSIWINRHGIQYEVRYFHNGQDKEVYFYDDEIMEIK